MKIAIFCANYPPSYNEGGISHYTQHLCRHLAERAEDILVVTDEDYCGSGTDGPIKVIRSQGPWTHKIAKRMVQVMRNHGVDMINLQYSPPMYTTAFKFAWAYMARHFVSTVSFHTLWGGSWINFLMALVLLVSADGVIATNSEIVYLLKRYLTFFVGKTRFIPIGANIEPEEEKGNYRKIAMQYSLDPDIPVVAYFGMCYPGKGMDVLFEATRMILERYRLNIQLLVIGGGISDIPEYVEEKRRLTSKLGIEDRVVWTGRIPSEEVSRLISGCYVVVLPFESGVSDRRGSLMAALAHGKAVVTNRPAVPVELFENQENMLWPENNDAGAIAETIVEVLQDSSLRQKLEKGAYDLARHFQWPVIARQTQTWFRDIMEDKKR